MDMGIGTCLWDVTLSVRLQRMPVKTDPFKDQRIPGATISHSKGQLLYTIGMSSRGDYPGLRRHPVGRCTTQVPVSLTVSMQDDHTHKTVDSGFSPPFCSNLAGAGVLESGPWQCNDSIMALEMAQFQVSIGRLPGLPGSADERRPAEMAS